MSMTPNIKHLPDAAAGVAAKQGWNDESIIIHLMGFLRDNMATDHEKGLELYFGAMADEENGDLLMDDFDNTQAMTEEG